MWHIFALVNVLGFPVHSVYPAVQNAGTDRALRNINVTPSASAKSTCNQCICSMWSHCSNTTERGWGPNYFVPILPADVTRSKSGEWFTAKSRGTKRKVGTPGNSASPTKQKQPLIINFNHQPPRFRHQTPVLRYQTHLRHQPPDLNQPHLSRQPPHLRHQPRLLHHVRLRHHLSFNPLQNLTHLYQHVFHLTRGQSKQVKGRLSTTVVSKRHGPKGGASLWH